MPWHRNNNSNDEFKINPLPTSSVWHILNCRVVKLLNYKQQKWKIEANALHRRRANKTNNNSSWHGWRDQMQRETFFGLSRVGKWMIGSLHFNNWKDLKSQISLVSFTSSRETKTQLNMSSSKTAAMISSEKETTIKFTTHCKQQQQKKSLERRSSILSHVPYTLPPSADPRPRHLYSTTWDERFYEKNKSYNFFFFSHLFMKWLNEAWSELKRKLVFNFFLLPDSLARPVVSAFCWSSRQEPNDAFSCYFIISCCSKHCCTESQPAAA